MQVRVLVGVRGRLGVHVWVGVRVAIGIYSTDRGSDWATTRARARAGVEARWG